MKKILLFLLLLTQIAIGQTATGTTKAGKYQMNTPDLGAKSDSVVVWNGTTKLLKYVPASTIIPVTNLNYTASPTTGIVTSSSGTNATIPVANTTNSGLFLPEEKIKLTFVETGAEVNVNADWNATSGDAEILNKPSIPSVAGLAPITYVDSQDDLKVDKVAGERLINATEIASLSNLATDLASKQGNITLTTTGTSGAATLVGNTLNIPSYSGGGSTPDATTTVKGIVKLAGDLAGTADLPTVPALSGKQATLVSGVNLKTVGGVSLLGSSNVTEVQNSMTASTVLAPSVTAVNAALALKATDTGVIHTSSASESKSGLLTLTGGLVSNPATAGDSGVTLSKLAQYKTVSSIFATTPSAPSGIKLGPDGNFYVANTTGGVVTKITPAGVVSTFASVGSSPTSLVFDSSGNLYTSNSASNNVSKVTPAGVSTILGTTGTYPFDITIDSSGNIYTCNVNSNNITKITPAGVSSIFGTSGTNPNGITIDSSNTLYVANAGSNNVSKITSAGTSSILGTTGTSPRSIVVDGSGNVYTSNGNSANVSKITAAGSSSILGTTGTNPYIIKIGPDGNLYIANSSSNSVTKMTTAGVTETFGSTYSSPSGIAFDLTGNTYVSNFTASSVSKISPIATSTVMTTNTEGKVVLASDLLIDTGVLLTPNSSVSNIISKKALITKEYLGTRIGTVAPTGTAGAGTEGEIRLAAGYIYWYVTGTGWLRSAGATF